MGKVVVDKLLKRPLLHVHDPLYLTDSSGVVWTVTIDTNGNIITSRIYAGNPMGLLLALTYPSSL